MASAGAGFICRGRPGAFQLPVALLWLRLLLLLQPPLTEAATLRPRGTPRVSIQTSGSQKDLKDDNGCSGKGTIMFVSLVCGKPTPVGRIFGGGKAPVARWPWQTSLLYHGRHICGATLIDHYWIVSAAHCFQRSRDGKDYHILLGYQQLHNPAKHSVQASVNQVIVHPDYQKSSPTGSDLALLQLHTPVKFSSYVMPACIPEPNLRLNERESCWITGWGMLTEEKFLASPYDLQEGEVGLIENMFCKSFFQSPTPSSSDFTVDEKMLCAVEFNVGRSICRGDSGGPLNCPVNNTWFLAGVASFSSECRHPVGPSVFTRMTSFYNWIKDMKNKTAIPKPEVVPTQGPPPIVTFPQSLATIHTPCVFMCLLPSQTLLLLTTYLRAL